MSIDERIEQLVVSQQKTQIMLANLADSVKRLERVAGVLPINDEELDRRLSELENRPPRKLQ